MKKLFSITVLLLIATTLCFSQKANVNKAKRMADAMENPDFDGAIDLIEQALKDETTKNDPNTWAVAANVYSRIINYEYEKPILGTGSTDRERQQESAYKAYDYYLQAVELEKIPDAKGKVSNKIAKKASEDLIWYFNSGWLVNYGASEGQVGNYAVAIKAFEKHLSIPDLPFVTGTKELPKPNKEKNDSLYWNVKYYEAIFTQLMADDTKDEVKKTEITNSAIQKYEAIKDKGYEENKIYQYLYNLYDLRNDTVNMLRIMDGGIVRFPATDFYLLAKIQLLINKGQAQEAVEYLQTAAERDPSNARYYNLMGRLYSDMGKRVEAMKNLDIAINLSPQNAAYQVHKGEAIYSEAMAIEEVSISSGQAALAATAKAKFKEAEECYLKALELDEKNYEALTKLKMYYFKIYDTKKLADIENRIKNL